MTRPTHVGRLLFNVLAMVAEFESDLIRMRTREGMKVAKAKGRLRGKQPKLSSTQEAHLVALYRAGEHTVSELEELFPVTRSTIYRAIARAGGRTARGNVACRASDSRHESSIGSRRGLGRPGAMLVFPECQPKGVSLPRIHPSRPPGASASRGGRSPVSAEGEASGPRVPEDEGVELRRTADGKGDGVLATRPFAAGETVMVGFLIGALTGNDSHATQVGPGRWARHGGLGPKVNHSCDPNCGVRLNDGQAFDFVARQPICAGQELTFDYAMRNFTIDHFPTVCLCGAARCRGSITGWKDLPAARKADYGELVAPYLRTMDDEIRRALR